MPFLVLLYCSPLFWFQSNRCLSCLFLRDITRLISCSFYMCSVIYVFYCERGGGGMMDLVYGSSPYSYMDCKVIFGDECCHIRRSGVRLDQCSCIGAFVVGLIIFGSYFYGLTTLRMSTRRLPVILFVSRFECPLYPLVCCAVCLWWPRG